MRTLVLGLMGLAVAACGDTARAHFPWLAVDGKGRAALFFSEQPQEREYRVPDCIKDSPVSFRPAAGAVRDVALDVVEEEGFAGRRSAAAVLDRESGGVLCCPVAYGNYNGMLLTYHAKAFASGDPAKWSPCEDLTFDVTPRLAAGKLHVAATWQGKPLPGAKATLLPNGGEPEEATTDDRGVAVFSVPSAGLAGCIVERIDKTAAGEANGTPYSTAVDYATVSFVIPVGAERRLAVPPLPTAVASFGGAVCDGRLYVYSGHTGEEHAHSRDNLCGAFRRVALNGDAAWEDLPMGTPLQGLPLVAHRGKLYRAGGLSFRNAAGEEEDMHSTAEVAMYDPRAAKWKELPPLPEPRSSHDAAVVGDVLYVAGGWTLSGSSPGKWLPTAWSFHLTRPDGSWEAAPSPPFQRRALALAAWKDQLVALGGMDSDGKVSRRCDLFDPASGLWSRLPDLPGDGMDGFGVSAWALGDHLYASSADGALLRLSPGAENWKQVGELAAPRFFHRLLPSGDGGLLAVGGASPEDGHLATIEVLRAEGE